MISTTISIEDLLDYLKLQAKRTNAGVIKLIFEDSDIYQISVTLKRKEKKV